MSTEAQRVEPSAGARSLPAAMPRCVAPEVLDGLAPDDVHAQRSRRDLQRLHRLLNTLHITLHALDRATAHAPPVSLLELGAGDGTLMLRLAQQRAARWPRVHARLLDRQDLVSARTLTALADLDWAPETMGMDVFDWLSAPDATRSDVIIANLFLHHFQAADLRRLLQGIADRTDVFFCCEPRRARLPWLGSHFLGVLGAGTVMRADAVTSVEAGFCAQELSALWPDPHAWELQEYAAGLFSHCFVAIRKNR